MKKFLIALMMLVSVNCSAATIEDGHLSEKMIYPVVHVEDKTVEQKINAAIIAEINRFVTAVKQTAQDYDFNLIELSTSYKVGSNEAGNTVILSIVITESNYYKGGVHPATYMRALNFNTANGELIDVSYLTDVGSGVPENRLIRHLEEKLKEKCERENRYLSRDAFPLKKLPRDFYWDENLHLHFIFQHYEVAPYSSGIIDVDVES